VKKQTVSSHLDYWNWQVQGANKSWEHSTYIHICCEGNYWVLSHLKSYSDMLTYRVSSRLPRYLSCSKSARLISPQIHLISSSQENRKFSVVSRTGFSPVINNSFITTCCKMSSSNQPQFSANFLFRQVKFELFFISMIDETSWYFYVFWTDLKYA
jgi:hypothetical protein